MIRFGCFAHSKIGGIRSVLLPNRGFCDKISVQNSFNFAINEIKQSINKLESEFEQQNKFHNRQTEQQMEKMLANFDELQKNRRQFEQKFASLMKEMEEGNKAMKEAFDKFEECNVQIMRKNEHEEPKMEEAKSQMPKKKLLIPRSLGVRINFNKFSKIIERNTPIPCKKTLRLCTTINDTHPIRYDLYEGERPIASLNKFIGSLTIDDIGAGVPVGSIEHLTLEVDEDGKLTAFVKLGDVEAKKEFEEYKPEALSDQQLGEMIREVEQNAEKDQAELLRMKAMIDLYKEIVEKKYKCETPKILELCEEFANWLEENKDAETGILQQKLEQFKRETQ